MRRKFPSQMAQIRWLRKALKQAHDQIATLRELRGGDTARAQAQATATKQRRFEHRDIEALCRLADANAQIATTIARDMIDGAREDAQVRRPRNLDQPPNKQPHLLPEKEGR